MKSYKELKMTLKSYKELKIGKVGEPEYCPFCGEVVFFSLKGWYCLDCGCQFKVIKKPISEAEELKKFKKELDKIGVFGNPSRRDAM